MTTTYAPERRTQERRRSQHKQATLILMAMSQFMVVLDVSVVNVALPAIKHSLDFTENGLQWVVNAYTVTFAGFLLLGGRAADLLGRRRIFVLGLVLFALASLIGGLADSRTVLILARLTQGLGGAVVAPATLSILTTTFTDHDERHRAIGIWGAVGAGGGAAGALAGGVITDVLGWRWILFINVPIALCSAVAASRLLAEGRNEDAERNFDVLGAISATAGLSLLVFGIVRTDSSGWGDPTTLISIAAGVALLLAFLTIETRFARAPLMPLRLFRSRSLSASNVIMLVLGCASFAMWFFFSLYLQEALGYSAIRAGVTFLPMTIALIVCSRVASRGASLFGVRRMQIGGMVGVTIGLFLFARLNLQGGYLNEMLAPSLITSISIPFAFIPSTLAATSGVATEEAGLASAVLNTSRLVGGALGLAILATLATARSNSDLRHPTAAIHTANQALVNGFHLAFLAAAVIAALGVGTAVFWTPRHQPEIDPNARLHLEM
jgi:EmrB/QacA subfamily drug resistance transporter